MSKTNFKMGDPVICDRYGKGKVVAIREGFAFCVLVVFNGSRVESYTQDGTRLVDGPVSLRHVVSNGSSEQRTGYPDLTKILKVGDPVMSYKRGLGKVTRIDTPPIAPITVKFKNGSYLIYTEDGRAYARDLRPDLFPVDQPVPEPNWPEPPKTFEWGGETYEAGEWVAVRTSDDVPFRIRKLADINMGRARLVYCSGGLHYVQMRKLNSFNK